MSANAVEMAKMAELLIIVLLVATTLIAVICASFIAGIITKRISDVISAAKKIAEGDLTVSVGSNNRDEIADLSNALADVKMTVEALTHDIESLTSEFMAGDIDAKIDVSSYRGEFQSVVNGINGVVQGTVEDIRVAIETVVAFGDGNFDVSIKQYPGKKEIMTTSFKIVQANLKKFNADIQAVITSAAAGNLDTSIDTSQYKGDWNKMSFGINGLLDSIVKPVREAIDVLNQLSDGNLGVSINGDYRGEFAIMKTALNKTLKMLGMYINEISSILTALSHDNLDQSVETEYIGQFSEIKKALNTIIQKLNHVMSEIRSAADQSAVGANQMSKNSFLLAQGVSKQAAAVEELNATITIINENTTQNAANARKAEELSGDSKKHAAKGNQYMNDLLSSMNNIKESSNSISKIIKVIDEIAFQTNLLALNAAVEAARAGEHGKGFAVVAEEVRNLAGRSQNSAKETAALIEESIGRVNEGTGIASQTAEALHTIVTDVSNIADIITNISRASNEQAAAISQVTEGITQITEVVQTNSATSEATASASEELSSQAELLKELVSVFILKDKLRARHYDPSLM